MGWAVLSDPGLLLSLPTPVVTLLVTGGVFYTVGSRFTWHGRPSRRRSGTASFP
jgi:hypothetical protein